MALAAVETSDCQAPFLMIVDADGFVDEEGDDDDDAEEGRFERCKAQIPLVEASLGVDGCSMMPSDTKPLLSVGKLLVSCLPRRRDGNGLLRTTKACVKEACSVCNSRSWQTR